MDDDEYDGDDEGQQQQRAGNNSAAQESKFTISPAFLDMINRKLTRTEDPPAPPMDASSNQALVLFRPLPVIALPPVEDDDLRDFHEGGMLDISPPKPPPPSPSMSSPFYVQDPGRPPFVCNDDDMEMEML